ncbi:MAG: cytochrome C [Burkholderiaceae bacterium]
MLQKIKKYTRLIIGSIQLLVGLACIGITLDATAIPLYARQTGQNCVSCHAGGQFPELTSYGRLFKLTGYTMGSRTSVPLAIMGTASMTKQNTAGSTNVESDYPQNGQFHFTTASLFAGGKITDNIGLFGQWTFNAYDSQNGNGEWVGHSASDQFDLRYADRFVNTNHDLIIGASLNNNPGVTDVWNTFNSAFGSVPGYVPVSNPAGAIGHFTSTPVSPIIVNLGQVAAGKNIYAYWNNLLYAELGFYQTANGVFSFLSQGISDANMTTKLKAQNPYLRLALNHDWGAHSAMIGVHAMDAKVYSDSNDLSSPTTRFKDLGIDGQYQYILDPHAVSAQFSYTRENQNYPDMFWNVNNPAYTGANANGSNTINYLRLKGTYVYQAKYGTSLGYVNASGSSDALAYAANVGNVPNTTFWVPEIFWTPIQNMRIGAQYYKFTKYNGTSTNYTTNGDGSPRNAKDNNTLFVYLWAAY